MRDLTVSKCIRTRFLFVLLLQGTVYVYRYRTVDFTVPYSIAVQ